MRKRNLILIALVFALIICATIQPAMAYFTTYVRAKGGHKVTFGDTTKITETFSNWTKKVTIRNEDDSYPVFIRAKVLYEGPYTLEVSGTGWTGRIPDDPIQGYYYYGSGVDSLTVLEGGQPTNGPLCVEIKNVPTEKLSDGSPNPAFQQLKDGESFSVVVVYESTPVRYKQDAAGNNIAYADWDADIIEVGSTTGTTGGNG